MAQLGESNVRGRALLKPFVVAALSASVFAASATASAQTATGPEREDCSRRLEVAAKAIAKDAYYAQAWTDSWYWVGSSLVMLNLTQAFQSGDYKRGESLTFAASSLLLMIQRPLALTSKDALRSIQASSYQDPCLALADANSVLISNKVDGEMHRAWPLYVINVGFNLAMMGVLTAVTHHWDFAGHSDLGLNTAVAIAVSELQVATYPSGSLKTFGTSLELSF